MAKIMELLQGSRDVTLGLNPKATLRYLIRDEPDEGAALSLLYSTSPGMFLEIPRLTWDITAITDDMWYGEVQYGYSYKQQTGARMYQFDTGGGRQHITQSISTVSRYGRAGKTPPNFYGAIGVSQNSVNGVDIVVPVFNFSEVNYETAGQVTDAYKQTLRSLTGRVNNAAWSGYEAGEVLFLGASGSMRAGGDWEMTYKFASSPNMTNITVGDITGIAKKGWEYLWVQYVDDEDTTAQSIIKRPHSVHIEQVYPYGDFSLLHV